MNKQGRDYSFGGYVMQSCTITVNTAIGWTYAIQNSLFLRPRWRWKKITLVVCHCEVVSACCWSCVRTIRDCPGGQNYEVTMCC